MILKVYTLLAKYWSGKFVYYFLDSYKVYTQQNANAGS